MISIYAKAYIEILEILKYLPKDEYSKIPKSKIEFYEKIKIAITYIIIIVQNHLMNNKC